MLLACSGAGANGPSFFRMYEKLLDEGKDPTCVAGVSAGAILSLFASLHSRQDSWREELRLLIEKFAGMQKHFLKPWHKSKTLNAISAWFYHDSLYRSGTLLQLSTLIAETCGSPTLNTPLSVGVWDGTAGVYKEKTFPRQTPRDDPSLLDHIVASASVPLLFPGKEIDGHIYRDGALGHEIPVDRIVSHPGEVVIITAHCLGAPPREPDSSMRGVGEYLLDLRAYHAMERDLNFIFWNARSKKIQLRYPRTRIKAKYNGTRQQLDELLKVGDDPRIVSLREWYVERRILRALRINS